MISYVVGIDPDSEAHGIAIYVDGVLQVCTRESTIDIVQSYLKVFELEGAKVLFSIEDVMSNQFIYTRNQKDSKAAQSKVAMHTGRCQQAQVELVRWLDHYKINYQLHRPQSGNWAKNKAQFEKITGWTSRSNEDGRSAAFFGFLALGRAVKNKNTFSDIPCFKKQ